MGFALMAESHLEHRVLLRCEFDRKGTIEFWDQPTSVPVIGTDKRGRCFRSRYTADVLTVGPSSVTAIEVKPFQECLRLCEERPSDWIQADGRFLYLPAKRAFDELGIGFDVTTDRDISAVEASNFDLLLHARANPSKISYRQRQVLSTILSKENVLPISDIMSRLRFEDVTPILYLIQAGVLYAELARQPLDQIDNAWVGLDPSVLRSALNARDAFTCAIDPSLSISTEEVPRPKDAIQFLSRINQLRHQATIKVSPRSLRRWRAIKRTLGESALVPHTLRRGNRISRLSFEHERLIDDSLRENYLSADSRTAYSCYGDYLQLLNERVRSGTRCADLGRAVSFKAFLRRVNRLDAVDVALARGGKRAANAAAPPIPVKDRKILACRPFQRAHIDHCRLKVHLKVVESGGRVYRLRPWLSAMRDEHTGAILAMSLSFRSPSRRACALLLRDCAMRWGRLPETIVVDNGREFESVYFEACLARLGIHKQSRPPGNPRFGTTIERAFGILKQELLSSLQGNTANRREDRGKSSSHKGCYRGKYTLLELHLLIDHYFFKLFNRHIVGHQLTSPEVMLSQGLKRFSSSGRKVDFDQAFLVATAIELHRQHTWDPQRGIRFRGRYYSHPRLRALENRRCFDVREEPWDEHCIHVCIKGEWLACYHGPRPIPAPITVAQICSSILWADSSHPVEKARIGRLLAQRDADSLSLEIEAALTSKAGAAKCKTPISLPSSATNISALTHQVWSEL
ncbi:integrase catalytic domain-containing protein [Dyella sp. Tek66A03]|uniref:integrase catalytic domain-containing protein n=1 Tax=Dyella sp. Tek66A03 TaxID=3458298 RepID=UPI00403E696C